MIGFEPDRHGGAQRRRSTGALHDVARFECPCPGIGRVRQLPQMGGHLDISAEQARLGGGTSNRADRLGKIDHGLARPGMGEVDDDLPGRDHLARLDQRVHHRAIAIGEQNRIILLVPGDLLLRRCRVHQGLGAVGGSLGLVVGRLRDGARHRETPIALLVSIGLDPLGPCRSDIAGLGDKGVGIVGRIDPHERLAFPDHLARIDQTLDDLTLDAKAEAALDAGRR